MNTQATPQTLPLKDIHLPDAPGFWPLAPGWWLLMLLIVVLLILGFYLIKIALKAAQKRKQKAALQERLLSEFKQIQLNYKNNKNKHQLACDISAFLRRIARHELNAGDAVSLSESEWLITLHHLSGIDLSVHSKVLLEAPYNPNVEFDVLALVNDIEKFCQNIIKQPQTHNQQRLKPASIKEVQRV